MNIVNIVIKIIIVGIVIKMHIDSIARRMNIVTVVLKINLIWQKKMLRFSSAHHDWMVVEFRELSEFRDHRTAILIGALDQLVLRRENDGDPLEMFGFGWRSLYRALSNL